MDGEAILVWAGIREALGGNVYVLPTPGARNRNLKVRRESP